MEHARPFSRRFDAFVAPARRRPALWRLVAGMVLGTIVYVLGLLAIFRGIALWGDAERRLRGLAPGSPESDPVTTLILLFSFGFMAVGGVVAARVFHRRGLRSLIGPDLRAAATDFAIAVGIVLAVYLPSLLLWSLPFDSIPNIAPGLWLALLPLTLLALVVQTGAEEVVFRGYLQQQLAARFRSPLVWMALPALSFGLLHQDPGMSGGSAAATIVAATLFGFAAADLTARSGSLGAAWGFHLANNFVAVALLSTEGTITGLALRRTPYSVEETGTMLPLVLADVALMVLAWLVLRHVLAWRQRQ